MTTTQKTYSLTNKPQLVDLNGDAVNFDLSFSVTSTKGQDFYAVVVDQNTLDNGLEPQFKLTEKGTISANVVSDNGVHENYYLMLKSDKTPCDVLVTINMSEKSVEDIPIIQDKEIPKNIPKKSQKGKKSGMSKFLIGGIIFAGLIIVGAILYFKVIRKKDNKNDEKLFLPEPHSIPQVLPQASVPQNSVSFNQNLLDKINKFNFPK